MSSTADRINAIIDSWVPTTCTFVLAQNTLEAWHLSLYFARKIKQAGHFIPLEDPLQNALESFIHETWDKNTGVFSVKKDMNYLYNSIIRGGVIKAYTESSKRCPATIRKTTDFLGTIQIHHSLSGLMIDYFIKVNDKAWYTKSEQEKAAFFEPFEVLRRANDKSKKTH